MPYMATIYH